jgi:hypothetical protein
MPGPNTIPVKQELDPLIGYILVGCTEGHGEAMTVSQALTDSTVPENIRNRIREQVDSINTLVEAGIDQEKAIGISLGGLALKDEHGEITRAQSQLEPFTLQSAGLEKK